MSLQSAKKPAFISKGPFPSHLNHFDLSASALKWKEATETRNDGAPGGAGSSQIEAADDKPTPICSKCHKIGFKAILEKARRSKLKAHLQTGKLWLLKSYIQIHHPQFELHQFRDMEIPQELAQEAEELSHSKFICKSSAVTHSTYMRDDLGKRLTTNTAPPISWTVNHQCPRSRLHYPFRRGRRW